jgi:hypothetical protein
MFWLAAAFAAEAPGIALPDPIWTLRLWEADHGALVSAARPTGLHVWRILDDGKIAWEAEIPCNDPTPQVGTIPAFSVVGPVFACSKGNDVLAFSVDTGARMWAVSGDAPVLSIAASLGDDPRFVIATTKTVSLLSTDKGKGSVAAAIPKRTPALAAVGGRVAVFTAKSGEGRWVSVPLFDSKADRKKSGVVPWESSEDLGPPDLSDGVLRGVSGPDVVKVDLTDGRIIGREPRDLVGADLPGERGVTATAPGTIALLDPRTSAARWSAPAKPSVLVHERRGRLIAASDVGFEAWSIDGVPVGTGSWTGVVTDVASSPVAVFALLEVLSPRATLKTAGQGHHPETPGPPTPSRASLVVTPLGTLGEPATPPKSAEWVDGTTLTWEADGKVTGRLVHVLGDPEWKLYQDDALIRDQAAPLVPLVDPPPSAGPEVTWVAGWEVPALVRGSPGDTTWVLQYPGHSTVLFREKDGQRLWLSSVDIP